MLSAAGFEQVDASVTCFSYGTAERVRTFGLGRAADCRDEWYVDGLTEHGFAHQGEIDALGQALDHVGRIPRVVRGIRLGSSDPRNP